MSVMGLQGLERVAEQLTASLCHGVLVEEGDGLLPVREGCRLMRYPEVAGPGSSAPIRLVRS